LKKKYSEKCDVWSCGVIMYFLLCGHPPFMGKTEKRVLEEVMKGLYELNDSEWSHISPEAIDLIRKLLEYDPARRISAEEALNHPWFTLMLGDKGAGNQVVITKALKNLQDFRAERKLQEAIWIFLVSYFSAKEETASLLTTFQVLDKDKNGVLSKQEIMEGYKDIIGKAQNNEEIEEIINKIDNNNNGLIDYSEFVAATINKMTLLSRTKLDATFRLFDKDGDGYLTIDELKEFLNPDQLKLSKQAGYKGEAPPKQEEDKMWSELISQADKNQDGKITLKEFKDLMLDMIK